MREVSPHKARPLGLLETALVQYLRCMFGALHPEHYPHRCDAKAEL